MEPPPPPPYIESKVQIYLGLRLFGSTTEVSDSPWCIMLILVRSLYRCNPRGRIVFFNIFTIYCFPIQCHNCEVLTLNFDKWFKPQDIMYVLYINASAVVRTENKSQLVSNLFQLPWMGGWKSSSSYDRLIVSLFNETILQRVLGDRTNPTARTGYSVRALHVISHL